MGVKNGFLIVAVLVAFALAYAIFYFSLKRTPELDFASSMQGIADGAVAEAKEKFGVTLDYSPESVKGVEKILGKYHDDPTLRETMTNHVPLRYGAYIGEVIRRHKGGLWVTPHGKINEPAEVQITYDGHTSFPMVWCGKRILNGDEDNVWVKFSVLTMGEGQVFKGQAAGHQGEGDLRQDVKGGDEETR